MAVPSVGELNKDLNNLRDAIISENIDVVRFVATNYRRFLSDNILFQSKNISSAKVDSLSCCLLPQDIPPDLVPAKSTGNGDCFFNSASFLLFGNEGLCTVLRLLTAAEIFLHTSFYASHPRFDEEKMHYNKTTRFMMSLSIDVTNGKNKFQCLKQQAIQTCTSKNWAGLIHFMALSSVIRRPIFSVYPYVSPALRSLFHGLIHPREDPLNNDAIYIMFTRDGVLNNKMGTSFQPNHFCPLFRDQNVLLEKQENILFNETDFPPLTSLVGSKDRYVARTVGKHQLFEHPPKKGNAFPSNPLLSNQPVERNTSRSNCYEMLSSKNSKRPDVTQPIAPQSSAGVPSSIDAPDVSYSPGESSLNKKAVSFTPARFGAEEISHSSPVTLFSKKQRPYRLLPRQWYKNIGIAAEKYIQKNTEMSAKNEGTLSSDALLQNQKVEIDIQAEEISNSFSTVFKKRPYMLLPCEWYENMGIAIEKNIKKANKIFEKKRTIVPDALSHSPVFPRHKKAKIDGSLICAQGGAEEIFDGTVIKKSPFPLLPCQWYKNMGIEAEKDIKENITDPADDGAAFKPYNTCSAPDATRNLELNISELTSSSMSRKPIGDDEHTSVHTSSSHSSKRPLSLLKKSWYQRRGKLAGKNIAREKQNLCKTETISNSSKVGVEFKNCSGTLTENKSHLISLMPSTINIKKRANLCAIIKVAEYLESSGPIVSTQEVGSIFRKEKHHYMEIPLPEEQHRTTSASIFNQLSRFLNIKQVYIHGKAFILENRNQKVNEVVERLSNLVNSEKVVNDKIALAIGDLFKDSLTYIDTKRDRDVLKALFAQATSTTFVAKLQGVSNKISIMNARDELRENIHQFKDIVTTSSVVRNDMTNEQQLRLMKRIIEKRKKNEMKLLDEFDGRGRKLKIEEFPEISNIIERVFEKGSADEGRGGGLESHPRLTTTTRYRSLDNVTFMRQAREVLLSCAPLNVTISLSSCYNYTNNYRENSLEAKRHHAGQNINANISLRRPPRNAVVDNKQVVNLHWSTCNVNYFADISSAEAKSYMVDSKDAKRIVLGDSCPVQKPGKTWKKLNLPDHDWDQSRNNAVTPMSHLFLEPHVTHKESIPSFLTTSEVYINPLPESSLTLHITRTGRAVTLLNLSLYEPETTSRAFNEIFFLLTKPSLDFVFRNPDSGKLKENFIFVVDNGPSETPSSPLVKMWLSRLLKLLNLDSISQVSFAEYHSKRNFVERVHSAENEVLSRTVFNSKSLHENAEPGSNEHQENMERMASDVKECIQQAKFNGRFLEVYRGVANNFIFDDDSELKMFLSLSEERKLECESTYSITQNDVTDTLSKVWGVEVQNFTGSYKDDYSMISNILVAERTSWNDKYQTTLWRDNNKWMGKTQRRNRIQPLPDYIRWFKTNELHYLTLERNSRITGDVEGRWNEIPGLFLPTRLLDLFFKIDPNPPDDIFKEIALLVWLLESEIRRYFKEANEQLLKSFEQDKLKEKWKGTTLYKNNSCAQLQEKCKQARLPIKGLKHQLVERLYENGAESTQPSECQPSNFMNIKSVPQSLNELRSLTTAQLKGILHHHGMVITGNKDELILRLDLARQGRYHLAFYQEQNEILNTINDGEQLVLEQRQDYLNHPSDVYRRRTYSAKKQNLIDDKNICAFKLENMHNMFKKLKEYINITRDLNGQKGGNLKSDTRQKPSESSAETETNLEVFFEIGTKVKVKWSAALIKDTGWKPGWYVAYVQSSDIFQDQIVVEHPSEPGSLYTLDVSPMVAEGSLKLG